MVVERWQLRRGVEGGATGVDASIVIAGIGDGQELCPFAIGQPGVDARGHGAEARRREVEGQVLDGARQDQRDDVALADAVLAKPQGGAQRAFAELAVADGLTVSADVGSTIAEALGGFV